MRYDWKKPDLVIHPQFYSTIMSKYDFSKLYNILNIDCGRFCNDCKTVVCKKQWTVPYLIDDEMYVKLEQGIMLHPYYEYDNVSSGTKPFATSYNITKNTRMYKLPHRGPRLVIWTKNDKLDVCATQIERINFEEIPEVCERMKQWAFKITEKKSIFVFDLDRTLIKDNGSKFECADEVLNTVRDKYDLVVLYSHGSALHVDEHLNKFKIDATEYGFDSYFDLILSNNKTERVSHKNLLYIYNYFPNGITFSDAVLMDDSVYNWTPEYSKLIIPYCRKTLKYALPIL